MFLETSGCMQDKCFVGMTGMGMSMGNQPMSATENDLSLLQCFDTADDTIINNCLDGIW